MNGVDCLAEIKKSSAGNAVPVIIYSTSITENVCKTARKLGAADCIKKHIQIGAFEQMLRDMLSKL